MLESVKGSSGGWPAVRRLNWLLTTSMRPCAMSAVVGNRKLGSVVVPTTAPLRNR